jgi:hypothetical protein
VQPSRPKPVWVWPSLPPLACAGCTAATGVTGATPVATGVGQDTAAVLEMFSMDFPFRRPPGANNPGVLTAISTIPAGT